MCRYNNIKKVYFAGTESNRKLFIFVLKKIKINNNKTPKNAYIIYIYKKQILLYSIKNKISCSVNTFSWSIYNVRI